ncbi:hypothetical protein F5148DRAFT_1275701 [Russula earlei]|uniref:Uncharacterized protein n=1 Tax=Russula earlei TaxID=71964 RepID=A0ACC0UCI9_9AGAM|nr:hypothetical protein F5148DRAFT_1275701 [Russula earlei]
MVTPRILFCGDIVWAHEESEQFFHGRAEVVHIPSLRRMDSTDRSDFLAGLKPGGRYEGMIYRTNGSAAYVGVFDRVLIEAQPPTVRWMAHNGAGYDQIDVSACKEKGRAQLAPRFGKAILSPSLTRDLTGKTLSILGLGCIGFRLAELAHAFPMRIICHSRRKVEDAPDWCEYFGQERVNELLNLADMLSVHVPLRSDTEHLVDEETIRKLKNCQRKGHRRGCADQSAGSAARGCYRWVPLDLTCIPTSPQSIHDSLTFQTPHGNETRDTQRKLRERKRKRIEPQTSRPARG